MSIHNFYRGGDTAHSSLRMVGIYNVAGCTGPDHDTSLIGSYIPEKPQNAIRFVCVSDTHETVQNVNIPHGDVLLHAGDFTMTGDINSVRRFNDWLGSLPHEKKL